MGEQTSRGRPGVAARVGGRVGGGAGARVDAAAQAAAAAACAEAAARVAEVLVILHSVMAQNITAAAGMRVCSSGAQRW